MSMCLFDAQDIPKALLQGQYAEEMNPVVPKSRQVWWRRRPRVRRTRKELPLLTALPCDFEEDCLVLRDLSLIKLHKDRQHFSMHPLVQFATKKWLVLHTELDNWSQRFISVLDSAFHDSVDGHYEKCKPLLGHVHACMAYCRRSDISILGLRAWASLTSKVARYHDYRDAFGTAEPMYRLAVEAFMIALGPSAPETLKCWSKLAVVYSHMGLKVEAEKVYRHVLRLQQESLGNEHEDALNTMDRIGDTLAVQERYAEAETLHVQALDIRLRELGPAHKSTQRSLDKRGLFLFSRSRYADAYSIWRQAYEARSEGKRDQHDYLWCRELDLIGLSLMMHGRSADAEVYLKESLAEKERTLSPECPEYSEVVESVVRVARVLAEQEDAGAETLFRRAYEWYDKQSCVGNGERLLVMAELANVLLRQQKLEEAESWARKYLLESVEELGREDHGTLEVAWILAEVLEKQNLDEEALGLYKRAYDGAITILGEQNVDTKKYKRDYSALHQRSIKMRATPRQAAGYLS